MDMLKNIGVRLSLDDFGTGYSSLAYLSRFPVDHLKIDRSFVDGIATDPSAASIATSVIALAHRMGLKVIAEGVETEAQLAYLARHGCDEMQGYLFSRPVPADDFAEMLREGRTLPTAAESAQQRTLLLVDDEANILSAIRRSLRGEPYRVLTASSAREGLDLLARNEVQVILSDQRMPAMSGTEFLGRVKALHPDTVRIVLSGYTELESVIQAVNTGSIYKFLTKPWDDEQLRGHLRDAFRYHEAIVKPRAAG
jgi:CheY-like chemotaxis protein